MEEHSKLPFWQGALWVLLGGGAAQFAGAYTASKMHSLLQVRGGAADGLGTSAAVILPSIAASGLSMVAVALLAPAIAGVPIKRALGLRPAPAACYGAAAFGTIMLGPFADLLMRAMERVFPDFSLDVVPMLHEVVRSIPVALALPAFALLPGVSEELMFRGVLQNAARRGLFAILVSGVGFALFHVDPHHVAGVLPLGLFLAWVGARCGTYVTMFAHTLNNAAAVAAVHSSTFDVGYGTEKPMPWPWVPVSLALVVLSAVIIARATAATGTPAHTRPSETDARA